jgi:predicted transcriptional regulator
MRTSGRSGDSSCNRRRGAIRPEFFAEFACALQNVAHERAPLTLAGNPVETFTGADARDCSQLLTSSTMRANDPVNRIMSEPVLTIGPDEPVGDMLRLFLAYPVHHLPVVEERRVVGMLSSADVIKLEFFLPRPGPAGDALLNGRFSVRRIMRTPVISVTEHESVQRAAELMATNGVHALPVVDRNEVLIGIVTTTDIIHCLLDGRSKASAADSPTLLAMQERVQALEQIAHAAKRYVNAGQDERLHAALSKAIERADELQEHPGLARTL